MARQPIVYTSKGGKKKKINKRAVQGRPNRRPSLERGHLWPWRVVVVMCSWQRVVDAEGGCVGGSGPDRLVVKRRLTSLGDLHFRWALAPPGGKNSLVKIMLSFWLLPLCVQKGGDKFSSSSGGRAKGREGL